MSDISAETSEAIHLQAEDAPELKSPSKAKSSKTKRAKRPKLSTQVNMWIRRIHLFSGLFMLPWVLLYGFTALLFNHPTVMTDWKTSIDNFSLEDDKVAVLPVPDSIAALAVASAAEQLDGQTIEIAENPRARFTRQAFGSVQNDDQSVSVILNMNNGVGYMRKRGKEPPKEEKTKEEKKASLEDGLVVSVEADPLQGFKDAVQELLKEDQLDVEELSIRSVPNIEFDAIVDGKPVRMRLAQERSRGRGSSSAGDKDKGDSKVKPQYKSKLSIVGSNPREMSARSFLLRLHMAHGYGIEKNSRWFWAIAVDLMFASMVFWGISGVIMWWKIKKTRKIGFILLAASAIVATWLAIGMHWQLVNG